MEIPSYRPPSEARSLLVRVTRNCPWNKCAFCNMYKGQTFSRRPLAEIKEDILSYRHLKDKVTGIARETGASGSLTTVVRAHVAQTYGLDIAALPWLYEPRPTAFLADSNSLILPAGELVEIVSFLRHTFPELSRVTSYARAKSVLKKSLPELRRIRESGLDRLHLGLETGDEGLLTSIKKGASSSEMVEGGLKAKEAGFTLSEYVILGLGGQEYWREHALNTAKVLNAINPHFIRLRTLRLEPGTPLEEKYRQEVFHLLSPLQVLEEERLFLENLTAKSELLSDHVSNYLNLNGSLPGEQNRLLHELDTCIAALRRDNSLAERMFPSEEMRRL